MLKDTQTSSRSPELEFLDAATQAQWQKTAGIHTNINRGRNIQIYNEQVLLDNSAGWGCPISNLQPFFNSDKSAWSDRHIAGPTASRSLPVLLGLLEGPPLLQKLS